jgi:hypothetical protein
MATFLSPTDANRTQEDIVVRNRLTVITVLKSLSERNTTHLAESCIMAWAQVGRFGSLDVW